MSNDLFDIPKPGKPEGDNTGRNGRPKPTMYGNMSLPNEAGTRSKVGALQFFADNEAHAEVIEAVKAGRQHAQSESVLAAIGRRVLDLMEIDFQFADQPKKKFSLGLDSIELPESNS